MEMTKLSMSKGRGGERRRRCGLGPERFSPAEVPSFQDFLESRLLETSGAQHFEDLAGLQLRPSKKCSWDLNGSSLNRRAHQASGKRPLCRMVSNSSPVGKREEPRRRRTLCKSPEYGCLRSMHG